MEPRCGSGGVGDDGSDVTTVVVTTRGCPRVEAEIEKKKIV